MLNLRKPPALFRPEDQAGSSPQMSIARCTWSKTRRGTLVLRSKDVHFDGKLNTKGAFLKRTHRTKKNRKCAFGIAPLQTLRIIKRASCGIDIDKELLYAYHIPVELIFGGAWCVLSRNGL